MADIGNLKMGTVQKLHKRVKFKLPSVWDEKRKDIRTEAKSSATMIIHDLLKDADLKAGDDMTVDVRVLIERYW